MARGAEITFNEAAIEKLLSPSLETRRQGHHELCTEDFTKHRYTIRMARRYLASLVGIARQEQVEDAVQEAWKRLLEMLTEAPLRDKKVKGLLSTIVHNYCVDMLEKEGVLKPVRDILKKLQTHAPDDETKLWLQTMLELKTKGLGWDNVRALSERLGVEADRLEQFIQYAVRPVIQRAYSPEEAMDALQQQPPEDYVQRRVREEVREEFSATLEESIKRHFAGAKARATARAMVQMFWMEYDLKGEESINHAALIETLQGMAHLWISDTCVKTEAHAPGPPDALTCQRCRSALYQQIRRVRKALEQDAMLLEKLRTYVLDLSPEFARYLEWIKQTTLPRRTRRTRRIDNHDRP